jgi:signal peptidase I
MPVNTLHSNSVQVTVSKPNSGPAQEPVRVIVRPGSRVRNRSWLHKPLQIIAILGFACLSYFLISRFLVQGVKVTGMSMAPTLTDSEHYLLNRWVYHIRSPQVLDVVVLRDPLDNGLSVKRIVAASGDSVFLKHGIIYVNGRKLHEPYLKPGTMTFTLTSGDEQSFQCGKDDFFVLGDNRDNSVDSRSYGPVPRRNILGMIVH